MTWKDPYAFSEDCFLVAPDDGIFVMDGHRGEAEPIYLLPEAERRRFQCHEPRPLGRAAARADDSPRD